MVKWNFLTTQTAINNFAIYTNTQIGRDIAIDDICDRVNAYVSCNNKTEILDKFKQNAKKTISCDEFKKIALNLILDIEYNFQKI